MSHTYTSCLYHCVFSTKNREKTIHPDFRERLWAYLGGIANEHRIVPLAIGGTDDHVHALLSLPATMPVSKAMQLLKGGSSLWVDREFPAHNGFEWQEGYGAFSIGISQVEATKAYIANQQEHHRHKSFREEYLAFLNRHDIPYDERYVLG